MPVDAFARQTAAKIADLTSASTGKGSAMIGYQAPGTGAATRTAEAVMDGDVRADDYGSLQQAADYASSETVAGQIRCAQVNFGPQSYATTAPLIHYHGQTWRGHGNAETTNRLNTKIVPAVNIDAIRVTGNNYAGNWFHFGLFENFTVMGPAAGSTSGWGINWNDGVRDITPQGQTTVRRVTVRRMAGGGIRIPAGGYELVLADCKLFENGGHGIYYKAPFNTSQQSVVFERIAADSSIGAGLYIDTLQTGGHVSVRDFKSEANINPIYGDGSTLNQANAIVLNNPVAGAGLTIDGMTHISSGSTTQKPGDAIVINGPSTPDLQWRNVQVRVLGTQTVGATPNVVSAASLGVAIPTTFPSGKLSNTNDIWRTTISGVTYHFGTVDTYQNKSVEGPAEQIAGAGPGRTLHCTSAATNEKTWLEVVAGGNALTRRAVDDAGATTIYEQINRSGRTITAEQHRRLMNTLGTTLVAADIALSAGWGNTATDTINGSSKDSRFDVNITCGGTGIAANPTATLTFKDGAFAATPIAVVNGWNDTDNTGIALKWVESTTTLVITFLGTPVAGKVYRIKGVLL